MSTTGKFFLRATIFSGIYHVTNEFQLVIHAACQFLEHSLLSVFGALSPVTFTPWKASLIIIIIIIIC